MLRSLRVFFSLTLPLYFACEERDSQPLERDRDISTETDQRGTNANVAATDQRLSGRDRALDAVLDQLRADASVISGDCFYPEAELDSLPPPRRHTPRWAFAPWISKDISDREDTLRFVEGFHSRGIPVGVVVLDSPWETNYNSLIPNPERYPNFEEMIERLRADQVRVVLWMTQMLNRSSFDAEEGGDRYRGPSPNYEAAARCNYFVAEGKLYAWWKGIGAGLDFFNPHAMRWWHAQQDHLFALGISGWKLDFGEQYIRDERFMSAAGEVSLQEYSERYYEDFLRYGLSRVGAEQFVTMVRPYDKSYEHEGRFFARPEHAPVAWVGDNRRDFVGLVDALDHLFRSALAGYVVIGSDIGGYLDFEDVGVLPGPSVPFSWEAFVRWTAMGAMTPFMQLHGRANLSPWSMPERADETVEIYRYWSVLHQALIPFWYSLAEQAYREGAEPIMRPLRERPEAWAGDWRYRLGEAFLVAPHFEAGGRRAVELPEGRWYDWWALDADPLVGGERLMVDHSEEPLKMPIYLAAGAIVPFSIESEAQQALIDLRALPAHHTILMTPPERGVSRFILFESDEQPTEIELRREEGEVFTLTFSRLHEGALIALPLSAPLSVTLLGAAGDREAVVARGDWIALAEREEVALWWEEERSRLWLRLKPSSERLTLRFESRVE